MNRFGFILLFATAVILLLLAAFSIISPYAVFGYAAIILLYLLFKRQAWIFLILAPIGLLFGQFISFEIQPNWTYEISLGELLLALVLIFFIIDFIFHYPKVKVKFGGIGRLLLIYAAIAAASFWYISDIQLYVAGMKVLFFGFIAYFLALNILTTKAKLKGFMMTLAIFAIVLSLQIFWTFYSLGFSADIFFNRSYIMIAFGPIALVAAVLSLLLPLILSLYFQADKEDKSRIIYLISFALGFIAVFVMLGKAAIISLLLGLAYVLWRLKQKRIGFILFVLVFGILGYTIFSQYAEGLASRIGDTFVDKNTRFRIQEYEVCWRIFKEHPLLGVGSGQQLLYYQRLIQPDYKQLINNYFVQAAVDYGIIGLTVIAFLVAAVYKQVRKVVTSFSGREQIIMHGLVGSLIAAFVNGLFEVTIFTLFYAVVFWMIVGLLPNLKSIASGEEK